MEVAGLVFGALPLVITALQYYNDAKKLGGRFLNRKKHVEKLIRALRVQEGALQSNLEWLLKAINEELDQDINELLQNSDVRSKIAGYLGAGGLTSFEHVLKRAELAVQSIAQNIRGFIPGARDTQNDLISIVKFHSVPETGFELRSKFKLMLHEDDVDEKITELERCTNILWQLQSIGTSVRQIEATAPSKNSKKLAKSLTRVQGYANRLCQAIVRGWPPGCHSTHEARLMLKDRIEAPAPSLKRQLDFNLIFASDFMATDTLWYEGNVEVVEGNDDFSSTFVQSPTITNSSLTNRISKPTVKFSPTPYDNSLLACAIEVNNICTTVVQARQQKKALKWYLMTQQRLHCSHPPQVSHHSPSLQHAHTVSLASLLTASTSTTDRSKKLPLKPRLFLALNLASTLIQLNTTPWLGNTWSKDSIYFLSQASSGHIHAGQGPHFVNPSEVDLRQPLVTRDFGSTPDTWNQPEPRSMILELGIMLLELGHETTIEEHFSGSGLRVDDQYYNRLSLAQRWLDDSEDHLTPTYFNVTARCVKCSFDGIPARPVWDDVLFKGIIQGVVEPLQEECRPRNR